MKRAFKALTVVLAGAAVCALGAGPALSADGQLCPMGGTMVKVEVDKEKALEWAKDRQKAAVGNEDSDAWSVLTPSRTDDDIAILVTSQYVFFGVAGKGGELDERAIEKAFGNDLRKLKDAVKKEMGDLWKANAAKVAGNDIQALSDAAGLGSLEKDGRDWVLKTEDCAAVDLDVSGL